MMFFPWDCEPVDAAVWYVHQWPTLTKLQRLSSCPPTRHYSSVDEPSHCTQKRRQAMRRLGTMRRTRASTAQSDEAVRDRYHGHQRNLHRGPPAPADNCDCCGFGTLRRCSREARRLNGVGCRRCACCPPWNPCNPIRRGKLCWARATGPSARHGLTWRAWGNGGAKLDAVDSPCLLSSSSPPHPAQRPYGLYSSTWPEPETPLVPATVSQIEAVQR